jgi:hypothetical protein
LNCGTCRAPYATRESVMFVCGISMRPTFSALGAGAAGFLPGPRSRLKLFVALPNGKRRRRQASATRAALSLLVLTIDCTKEITQFT